MDLGTDAFRVDMAASLIKGDTDGSYMKAFWNEIRAHIEKRNPECLLISEWGSPTDAVNATKANVLFSETTGLGDTTKPTSKKLEAKNMKGEGI